MIPTGLPSLDRFLGGGLPDVSSILVTGPPAVGKEALAYRLISAGLNPGDFCLYVTHRPVSHVLRDMNAFGVGMEKVPEWLASAGSQKGCDLNDPTKISLDIKQIFEQNKVKKARIVVDVLSPLWF